VPRLIAEKKNFVEELERKYSYVITKTIFSLAQLLKLCAKKYALNNPDDYNNAIYIL
jgi:hypothetical protein